jgi:3',5'-cyclic AMP phosphodiesterase CpdA
VTHYNPGDGYVSSRDVRQLAERARRIAESAPNGRSWVIVTSRRAGKTWLLRGLRHVLAERYDDPESAVWLDLRSSSSGWPPPGSPRVWLLDEPGPLIDSQDAVRSFLNGLTELQARGSKVLVACTPAEWSTLRSVGDCDAVLDPKDVTAINPLTDVEVSAMTARAPDWAPALAARVPAQWRSTAYRLELLLSAAEQQPNLRADVIELLRVGLALAAEPHHFYVQAVFRNGLTSRQRDAVRRAAGWRGDTRTRTFEAENEPGPEDLELLAACGLLHPPPQGGIADPILAAHLPPPLRIHHVSDVHVGPRTANRVDGKAGGSLGRTLQSGAGQGPVRNTYLVHLGQLAADGDAPHLLVISGDLAEHGTAAQYDEFLLWLEAAASTLAGHPALGPDEPRVLLVGGNHDVDWTCPADADPQQRHASFARAFAGYRHPHLEQPPPQRLVSVVTYADAEVEVLLLGSAEFGGEQEHSSEWQWLHDHMTTLQRDLNADSNPQAVARLLNDLTRVDPGLVQYGDLERAKKHPWRMPVRVAVVHHPVSQLPGVEIAPYTGMLNAGDVKELLFAHRFCLVLHGHLHKGWFAAEQWFESDNPDWQLRIASAGSLGSAEVREHHSFNEIELLREGSEHRIIVRRVSRIGDTWRETAAMGPFQPGR